MLGNPHGGVWREGLLLCAEGFPASLGKDGQVRHTGTACGPAPGARGRELGDSSRALQWGLSQVEGRGALWPWGPWRQKQRSDCVSPERD